ncbi:MAG TPA: response regulator transcription factor [Rudaea sp.]
MRVLLADDHNLVRAGIRRLIESSADIEVVAEAQNGDEALDLAALTRPDVAIVDLEMPGRGGLDVIAQMRERFPEIAVVIMSMHDNQAHVRAALERGARGFIVKEAAPAELELALRAAHAGQTFLSPKVSARMLNSIVQNKAEPGVDELSPRQREILTRLGQGKANKEIAAELGISVKTVETHRSRMMEILGLKRSGELLRFAMQHSLGH